MTRVEAPRPGVRSREVLANRDFTIYSIAAFTSNAGTFMQTIGVAFVLRRLTGQDGWVGAGVFASMIPSLLVGPIAGPLCDRFERRRILLASNGAQAAIATVFFLLSLTDHLTPWRMVGLLVAAGMAGGFQIAASQTLVAGLVPPAHLLQAVRLYSVGFNAARAIGPAFAGIVLDVWGETTTFALNAASFGVVLLALLVIRPRPQTATSPGRRVSEEFADGVRYSARHRSLTLCMVSALAVTLFGASVAQLAAGVALGIFDVEGGGLGLLVGAYGLGSAATAITLTFVADRFQRSRVALTGVFLYGLGVIIVVSTTELAVGLAGYLVMGVAHILTGISTNTTIQAQVDDRYRGRVMSLYLMCMLAGMPIGALIGGQLGDVLGLRQVLAGFGVILIGFGVAAVVWLEGFASYDDTALEPSPPMPRPAPA